MKHIHLDTCPSTQIYLRENLSDLLKNPGNQQAHQQNSDQFILISTDLQTAGIGRTGNRWDQYQKTICFSFTLTPNEVLSLTALELSLQVIHFIQKYYSLPLKVKWPNDILDIRGNKCGGIICNTHSSGLIIAGIGLNLTSGENDQAQADMVSAHYKTPLGYVGIPSESMSTSYKSEIPAAFYEHLLNNRLNSKAVTQIWPHHCFHINRPVTIIDGDNKTCGLFSAIGEHGEAILQSGEHIFSGSLFIDD